MQGRAPPKMKDATGPSWRLRGRGGAGVRRGGQRGVAVFFKTAMLFGAPSPFTENAPPQHLHSGAPPSMRKSVGLCTPAAGGGLSTPAHGKATVARMALGDISNRKSRAPEQSGARTFDPAAAKAHAVTEAASSLSRLLDDTNDLPSPERASRHAAPASPVHLDPAGGEVEAAVRALCSDMRGSCATFGTPYQQRALLHRPVLVEPATPTVIPPGAAAAQPPGTAHVGAAAGASSSRAACGPARGATAEYAGLELDLEMSAFELVPPTPYCDAAAEASDDDDKDGKDVALQQELEDGAEAGRRNGEAGAAMAAPPAFNLASRLGELALSTTDADGVPPTTD
jgi:hypothetical protein